MRIFRYIFDLPWWVGLPILLGGNLLIPMGELYGFISGLIIFMFGCWTFSKLLKPNDWIEAGQAIVCIPLMILSLYFLNVKYSEYLLYPSKDTLYVLRTSTGLFFGLLSFQGFRK